MVRFARSGGLWPPPQSIDIIPQILLLLRVFSHGSHSSCCVYSPTDFTEFTELLAECILPQISRIYTELLAECILPQISQNSQKFLLRLFSHRFHRFTQKLGCLQGGALVSARLCRLPEQEVHQPSKKTD